MSNYPEYKGSPSRQSLAKQAVQGGFAVVGGLALLILKGIAGIPIIGPIVGIIMIVAGLGLRNKNTAGDSFSSIALIVLGCASVATIIPGIGGLASFLMGIAAFGLLGFGIWKLWQYHRASKTRP